MKARSTPIYAVLIAFAAGLIGITSSPASAQEVTCPCFDANELKQEISFVEEMIADGGELKLVKLDILQIPELGVDDAFFEFSAYIPDDTEVLAGSKYYAPASEYRCSHYFYFLDTPQHPNVSMWNITEMEFRQVWLR